VKIADLAHDGLARAIRPAHAMLDGDTIFALSTHIAAVELPGTTAENLTDLVGHAAADALVQAVLDAAQQTTSLGGWLSVAEVQAQLRRQFI
jgi:L-aminopeptidase/D-esterase-like protein